MHATSVVERPKAGAMYRCYVQDPTGHILAAFSICIQDYACPCRSRRRSASRGCWFRAGARTGFGALREIEFVLSEPIGVGVFRGGSICRMIRSLSGFGGRN